MESSEVLSFAQLYAAVQLEPANKSPFLSVKREETIIVDTVDLTAEESEDHSELAIRTLKEKHDQWLDKLAVVAQQYQKIQEQQHQLERNKSRKVICLDSDPEEEENDHEIQEEALNHTEDTPEDLFDDSCYPITVTPIDSNADLEISDNEDISSCLRRNNTPLRTYVAKKTNSCSVSSADETGYQSPGRTFSNTVPSLSQKKHLSHRRNSIHISSTPPHHESDVESSNDDDDDYNNPFYNTSSAQRSVKSSNGPGVPFASINSTLTEGRVIFSQAMPGHNNFQSDEYHGEQVSCNTLLKNIVLPI